MHTTCKNTRNYIFSLPREKRVELILYFRGQNETEYNTISPGISILLL